MSEEDGMSDIVERLRSIPAGAADLPFAEAMHCEAADEIERLRAVIAEYLNWCGPGPDRDSSDPALLRIRADMRKAMQLPMPGRKTG